MMDKDIVCKRMEQFRSYMSENGLNAFIVVSSDPHSSEYVADRWKCREWLSGFDGSAGTVVVTADKALLWTDSRYWLAADKVLAGTEKIILYRIDGAVAEILVAPYGICKSMRLNVRKEASVPVVEAAAVKAHLAKHAVDLGIKIFLEFFNEKRVGIRLECRLDTGDIISVKQHSRVRARLGIGLGLTVSRRRAEIHGEGTSGLGRAEVGGVKLTHRTL